MRFAMLTLIAFLTWTCLADGFFLHHGTPRNVTAILKVTNGGTYGAWSLPRFCSEGHYAVGYKMKIEGNQHSGDDTSLNAIELLCESQDGQYGGEIYAAQGPWGSWHELKQCEKGDFLDSFTLQSEGVQGGGDDTSANYIKFNCAGPHGDYEIVPPPGHGLFGSYGVPSGKCPKGSAICGIKDRVESDQHSGDDTALNDVQFYCCAMLY